nr:hypothetical protein [Tanacetum cinerariifolium]
MKHHIKNMKMNEYWEYRVAKERKLWDNVRSRRNPTNYDEADIDSFHQNNSNTFSYSYSHNLTPPCPLSLPVYPYPKNYLVSTNVSNNMDIKSMTTAEYNIIGAENLKRMVHDNVLNSYDNDTYRERNHES